MRHTADAFTHRGSNTTCNTRPRTGLSAWGFLGDDSGGDARCYGVATCFVRGEGVIFGDRSEIEIVRVRCDCGGGEGIIGVGVDILLGNC